jgi:pimeloyl-ACP methyl ester carboxylesterase
MKTIKVTLLLFISTLAFGQDKYSEYRRAKKTIGLSTGIYMSYIDMGDPNGTPLLLLHGYTDTSRSFQLLIEELLKIRKDIRLIAPDLRGHGDSSIPDATLCSNDPEKCFTQDLFAKDIVDLMNQLKIKEAVLVGHSMGSVIAQNLASNYSDRFSRLVLMGTFVSGKDCVAINQLLLNDLVEGDWKLRLEKQKSFNWPADAYEIKPDVMGEEVKTFLRDNWVTEACAPIDFLSSIYPETIGVRIGTWIGAIRMLASVDNKSLIIQNLKIPTLILWASQDSFIIQSDQDLVKETFAAAARKNKIAVMYKTYGKVGLSQSGTVFNEVGHNLHWASPKQVALDIDSFMENGYPIDNLPYANPLNVKEILIESKTNVMHLK